MRTKMILRRVVRDPQAILGLTLLLALVLLAYVGPHLGAWEWNQKDFRAFRKPPSESHWFGTTQIGGDVWAITLRGMQKSIIVGLLAGVIATFLAAIVGAVAGYFGGWVDRTLMWFTDLLLVLPSFLIIAILSPRLKGESWLWFVLLLALFAWMLTGRVVRAMTISLREREYVLAAVYAGVPTWKVITRHILPNLASLLIIDATLGVGGAILGETGLSFFGFGIQPPDVSLGTVIADSARQVVAYPWIFLPAAGLLILLVLSINLVGDALRDAMDPGKA
ncbi:ABC transporter permease [Nonomuraea sp. NPDC050310]|uniref:ABC transporter permease n=1 Tax=unclassified Nonomuraea TaxID=2593643 RepID=UPI0033E32124